MSTESLSYMLNYIIFSSMCFELSLISEFLRSTSAKQGLTWLVTSSGRAIDAPGLSFKSKGIFVNSFTSTIIILCNKQYDPTALPRIPFTWAWQLFGQFGLHFFYMGYKHKKQSKSEVHVALLLFGLTSTNFSK